MADVQVPSIEVVEPTPASVVLGVVGGALKNLEAGPSYGQLSAADGATILGTPEGTVQEALDGRVKAVDLAASGGAGEVGAFLAEAGMRPGYASDLIYKAIYTSTLDTTDIGASMVLAMAYCRANDAELVVDADVTLDISDGATSSTSRGVYMQGCPRIRGAGGVITLTGGRFGLDVSGPTINVRDLQTIGQGWETTDLTDPPVQAAVFGSAETFANYENITHANIVTALSGQYRASRAVIDDGSERVQLTNVQASNAISAALLFDNDTVVTNDVGATNASTGLHFVRTKVLVANNTSLTNTRAQAAIWPGKNKPVSPVGFNGLDAILCEECEDVTINGYRAIWASERGAYIQATKSLKVSGGIAINSDGNKLVGWDRNHPLKSAICNDSHVLLTPEFEAADLRSTISLVTTYFSDVLKLGGGSGIRTETNALAARALVTVGANPYTSKSIDIDASCYGDGVQTIVYGVLMSETAAQLAVIDPAQTFVIAERVTVGGGVYSFTGGNQNGALVSMRDTEASADAKAAVAITAARFSDVQLNLTTNAVINNRPNWIVDPRYIGSIYAVNVSSDGVFRNVGPNTAGVQATLKFVNVIVASASTIAAQLTALDGFTFGAGSSVELIQQPSSGAVARARMLMRADGLLKSQTITIDINGPGYWQLGAAAAGVINYRSVGAYIGNVSGATLTDVVGAKNITMTAGASNFELRGDLAPTVKYAAQLSVSL